VKRFFDKKHKKTKTESPLLIPSEGDELDRAAPEAAGS
jgi:hypothetical protein